ncbi:MAG: hypothetical protein JO303_03385 [Caulobacteraceae bacterium]|nr:hypothetical protein [Caulobacteraceae bacterium]
MGRLSLFSSADEALAEGARGCGRQGDGDAVRTIDQNDPVFNRDIASPVKRFVSL